MTPHPPPPPLCFQTWCAPRGPPSRRAARSRGRTVHSGAMEHLSDVKNIPSSGPTSHMVSARHRGFGTSLNSKPADPDRWAAAEDTRPI